MLDEKNKTCLNCDTSSLLVGKKKFCSRKCQNTFNTRKRRREASQVIRHEKCLKCDTELTFPRWKFCSRSCQLSFNHKKSNYVHSQNYYSRNPRNFFQSLIQKKNKKRQDLSLDFLEDLYERQKGLCAISGVEMTFLRGQGKVNTNISIDKIDPNKEYTEDNIQLVCYIVNIFKHTLSLEELLNWCETIMNNNVRDNSSKNLKVESKSKNRSFPRTKTARRKK